MGSKTKGTTVPSRTIRRVVLTKTVDAVRIPPPAYDPRDVAFSVPQNLIDKNARLARELDQLRARKPASFKRGKELAVILPWTLSDFPAAYRLLSWVGDLGQVAARVILLCADATPAAVEAVLVAEAQRAFAAVTQARTSFDLPVETWPVGPNWMMLHAARFARNERTDFLLLEPDCIPLRTGWFEASRAGYVRCGMPYMGFIEPAGAQHPRHMAGCGVYHHGYWDLMPADQLWKAWDVASAEAVLPLCAETRLIQQVWAIDGKPPTFPRSGGLGRLAPDAVLFHRNKDGTLIERLREEAAQ